MRNKVALQNAILMNSPWRKPLLVVVLASYVLATVGAPLLHRHVIRATWDAHSDCGCGSHGATEAECLVAGSPAAAHVSDAKCSETDGRCPVCHFLAQKWLSAESAAVTLSRRFSRRDGLGEVPRKVRPVPLSWRIRAPPAMA